MSLWKVFGIALGVGIVFLFFPAVWSLLKDVVYAIGIYVLVGWIVNRRKG